jgi:ABC-2 type transport system ATP-binding protein
LAGLLEIEAEEAMVLGHDLRGDPRPLKERIGYVPQSFGLHRDLTVLENLRFVARVHGIPEPAFRERLEPLLERTGLAAVAGRRAGDLSGGMRTKLSVVSALLPGPDLLVLDEPTAGVDVVARAEILQLLSAQRERSLIVLATSDLEEATACDLVAILDRGRLVASGTPEALAGRVPFELYRAWCDEPWTIARGALKLPYVTGLRVGARFVRIEVARERSPGLRDLRADLSSCGAVRFLERLPVDLEAALLAVSRTGEPPEVS